MMKITMIIASKWREQMMMKTTVVMMMMMMMMMMTMNDHVALQAAPDIDFLHILWKLKAYNCTDDNSDGDEDPSRN